MVADLPSVREENGWSRDGQGKQSQQLFLHCLGYPGKASTEADNICGPLSGSGDTLGHGGEREGKLRRDNLGVALEDQRFTPP
jgi:hypothetical protein